MSIHSRSPVLSEAYEDRDLARRVRAGTKAMRDAGERYLPQEASEKAAKEGNPYAQRLSRTTLTNIPSEAVSRMVGKLFRKDVIVEAINTRFNKQVEDLKTNIDGEGKSLNALTKQMAQDGTWYGSSFALVDWDSNQNRPTAKYVHIDDIMEAIYSGTELVILRLREFDEHINYEALSAKSIKKEKVYIKREGKVYWTRFTEGFDDNGNSNGDSNQDHEWVELRGFDRIPLFVALIGEKTEHPIICRSPMQNMLDMTELHWKKMSDFENILHVTQVPQIVATGAKGLQKMMYGPNQVLIIEDSEAKMDWLEPKGNSAKIGQESLSQLEARMEAMGFSFITPRSGSAESATGRALKANESNSVLGGIANSLSETLEQMVEFMLGLYPQSGEPDVSVHVNTDFGVSINAEELTALNNAVLNGHLSRHNYLKELMKRGVLDEELDLVENDALLQAELDTRY